MKTLCLGLVLVLSAVSAAQMQPPKLAHKAPSTKPSVLSGPVTKREAKVTFDRVWKYLFSLTSHKEVSGSSALPPTDKPVTKEEILSEFDRIYVACKPYFKVTPAPVSYQPSVFSIKNQHARGLLEKFVKNAFVARVGVLATSPNDTMGVQDFGDAVGTFITRLADLTHMPSPEYSPSIRGMGPDYIKP